MNDKAAVPDENSSLSSALIGLDDTAFLTEADAVGLHAEEAVVSDAASG